METSPVQDGKTVFFESAIFIIKLNALKYIYNQFTNFQRFLPQRLVYCIIVYGSVLNDKNNFVSRPEPTEVKVVFTVPSSCLFPLLLSVPCFIEVGLGPQFQWPMATRDLTQAVGKQRVSTSCC